MAFGPPKSAPAKSRGKGKKSHCSGGNKTSFIQPICGGKSEEALVSSKEADVLRAVSMELKDWF